MTEFEKTIISKVHCDHTTKSLWCNDRCWIVSKNPINLYKLYDEGLINA